MVLGNAWGRIKIPEDQNGFSLQLLRLYGIEKIILNENISSD
jgi:hypothetical protein